MRNHMRRYALAVAVMLFVGGCCYPNVSESLSVTLHPQETNSWCWAASGQMVMDYLGHDVSQCTQANNRFGRNDCCNSPVPNACVRGGWPEFSKYGFTSIHTSDAALSWDDLKKEISRSNSCGNRPFCFTWHWTNGGGHMMTAIGYKSLSLLGMTLNFVEVNDPWPPNVGTHKWISYSSYVSGDDHTHWDDYYQVRYIGGK